MLAGMIARPRATSSRTNSAGRPFAHRDELHLGRDLALARVVQLRHARVGAPATHPRRTQLRQAGGDVVILRAARVVHEERRLVATKRDLAHRHAHAARTVDERLL